MVINEAGAHNHMPDNVSGTQWWRIFSDAGYKKIELWNIAFPKPVL